MSTMGGDDYVVRIRAVMDAAGAESAARQTSSQIREAIVQGLGNIPISFNIDQAVSKIEQELSRQIASSPRLQASQLTKVLDPNTGRGSAGLSRDAVRAVQTTGGSPLDVPQMRLTIANVLRDVFRQGVAKQPYATNESGGLKDPLEPAKRLAASLQMDARVASAEDSLAKARERFAQQTIARIAAMNRDWVKEQEDERRRQEALGRETVAINRRTAAEQTAAERARAQNASIGYRTDANMARIADRGRAEAERQANMAAADEFVRSNRQPFENVDLTTRLGRAQSAYNSALMAETAAHERLAKELASETRTVQSVREAMRSVENASRALGAAQERVGILGATGGGLRQQFMTGFKGETDRPYAEQIGQAFKFSVFYGTAYKLLFALTQTFQDTLQEGIEFQQAVTELKLATGQAKDHAEKLANTLGDESVAAGFAPSQGAQIGARAVGLYGVSQSDAALQDRVAELSTRVVSRLSFSSGMQPADLQESLAAIANAFGGGYESQQRVADLDAYFSHRFGTTPGGTIQTVAESGSAGAGAGFSLEETSAMAALLQGRTGQSSAAVAGYLAQIFSRGGEGSLTALTGKYGIDSTQTLAEQIRQLARIFQNANPNQQSEISAAFGRGKVQNAVVALLNGFDEVEAAAGQSKTGAAGSLDKAFNERIDNLGGQIQLTSATFKQFANELGQSGLLDVIGASVVAGRELLDAGTNVLELWNQLPRPLRDVALAAGALAVSLRLAGGSAALAGRASTMAINAGGVAGTLANRGTVAGALGGGALAALTNPVTLAIGGLLAIGAIKGSIDDLHKAADAATSTLDSGLGSGATADDLRTRADLLGTQAQAIRDKNTSFMGRLGNLVRFNPTGDTELYGETLRESFRLRALADQRAQQQAQAKPSQSSLITAFDSESLKGTMDALEKSGATASDRFRVLADAIDGGAAAAQRAAAAFSPENFAGDNAADIQKALRGVKPTSAYVEAYAKALVSGGPVGEVGDGIDKDAFRKQLSPDVIQKRLASALRKQGVSSEAGINYQSATLAAEDVLHGIDLSKILPDADMQQLGDYRNALRDAFVQSLLRGAQGIKDVIEKNRQLTSDEVMSAISEINTQSEAILKGLPQTDLRGAVRQQRARVQEIKRAIASGDAPAQAFEELASAQRELGQAQFDQLEAQRRVAQQNAHSAAAVKAAGMRALRAEIKIAIESGNPDLLAKIIGQAGKGAIAIAKAALASADQTAKAAAAVWAAQHIVYNQARAKIAEWRELNGMSPGNGPAAPEQDASGDALAQLQTALDNAVHADPNGDVYTYGTDVPGLKGPSAKADKPKTDWAALKYARYLLARDITDPLVQARAELVRNLEQLKRDRKDGATADVIANDKLSIRQARANIEATKFQQRLDDMQTADDLGRISHEKYLSYLQHEHDRLTAVKHRTRQQQDQLNQIDQLMKQAADSMQGQWNFGDIQLPKPYQIRRYIEDQAGAANAQTLGVSARAATTSVTNTFFINGADTAAVTRIINDVVGKDARTTTTAPRRK